MQTRTKRLAVFLLILLALGAAHTAVYRASEPFYYNDETRHVMTGLYFKDLLHDMPVGSLREYTVAYYLQYPALGLLVWPPLFHALEGAAMSVFGTSPLVPLALVGLFAAAACAYLFLLVLRTHDLAAAAAAVLVFGLSPMVFEYSHYVMLEVPTLALALAAVYHFVRFLGDDRRRDLALAALFSALAALTRFDAVYLLPLFLLLLAGARRRDILRRKDVLAAAAFALCLVLPFYAFTLREIGWFHIRQATETLSPDFPAYSSWGRYLFYPASLPSQVGVFALVAAALGLVAHSTPSRRRSAAVYYAMIAATYVTFTPVGEMDSRHSIYWVPAFSFFAARGPALIAGWLRAPKLYAALSALLVGAIAVTALEKPRAFVLGYEEAARYVLSRGDSPPFCLFVGRLNGDFIYQVRRHDAGRGLWVLRADKLFFNYLISPGVEYREYAASDAEVLDTIFKYDPAYIVVEESQGITVVPAERKVRATVMNHPERFMLEHVVPVSGDAVPFRDMHLMIFKNVYRNPNPERRLEVDLLMLRRSIQGAAY